MKQIAEKHFVVVNWDQPGVAKSYRAADFKTLTPEQYVADTHALTGYLQQRFGKDGGRDGKHGAEVANTL